KKKETCRFWRPVTFYLFGPGGSGKTGLVQELFSNELYDKPKKQRSGSNWWNGYEGQEIVLIDEFYTKIEWGDMVNVLNDFCHNVEKKHGGFEPFIAKYVFLTATKPPEEAYNFSQTGVTENDNKRDFGQFDRRLDYIIEFQDKWYDDMSQRTTWIIFHNTSNSIDQIIEKSNKLNLGIDGEHIIENNYVYWRKAFPEYKKRYLRDYSNSRQLFQYRFESENNQSENNQLKKIQYVSRVHQQTNISMMRFY
ncbi:16463_t:CDS:2, partial [Gigaspora rosea]